MVQPNIDELARLRRKDKILEILAEAEKSPPPRARDDKPDVVTKDGDGQKNS